MTFLSDFQTLWHSHDSWQLDGFDAVGKNVDSCTRPSRWIRIWSVWDTIKIRLFLASRTTLRRHLRHSKTMAQACSSVIGAEKLPVISSNFKQDSWSSWQGDQEVSQNLLSGGEAILENSTLSSITFHRKQFFRLLARKFCVQLLKLYVKGWVVSKCTLVCYAGGGSVASAQLARRAPTFEIGKQNWLGFRSDSHNVTKVSGQNLRHL